VVVGGGPTGSEFAHLFNRLGVQVTWLVSPRGVLPMFAPDAGRFLAEALFRRGVKVVIGPRVSQIKRETRGVTAISEEGVRHRASAAFLAVGRLPDTGRLNLPAAGLRPGPGGELPTDACGGTAVPGIYAVGDVTGLPMLANQAMAQAWVAGRHAAGAATSPFRPETVVQAVYTEPQIAQVGSVEGQGPSMAKVRLPFAAGLKAHLLPGAEGFVELVYDTRDGRVLGGLAAGPHAADLLASVAVAIQLQGTVGTLAAAGGANPTISELAFLAARAAHGALPDRS
jgi:pyruvate/2-oxoglutarate dehydrogenase complex dihydrolipoamide dehydrogenase (E3) component